MEEKEEVIGGISGKILGMVADLVEKLRYDRLALIKLELFLEGENPFSGKASIIDWQRFYQELFEKEVDLSGVKIPKQEEGFNRLIVVAKDLTLKQVFEVCERNFSCSSHWKDLDKSIAENTRESNKNYAVLIRSRREADCELKEHSVDQLTGRGILGITLLERMLYGLKYWHETGKHLDSTNWTLCSGSFDSEGRVPRVDCCCGQMRILWWSPQAKSPYARVRAVILSAA